MRALEGILSCVPRGQCAESGRGVMTRVPHSAARTGRKRALHGRSGGRGASMHDRASAERRLRRGSAPFAGHVKENVRVFRRRPYSLRRLNVHGLSCCRSHFAAL